MQNKKQSILSQIPPVNDILNHARIRPLIQKYSRHLILSFVQQEIQSYKEKQLGREIDQPPMRNVIQEELADKVAKGVEKFMSPNLRNVINATGIILHTGLGRAPLSDDSRQNLTQIAEGYCSLEMDLESGERGDRTTIVEALICKLTGAESACVVNNNAAAVLLALNTLSFGKETIISRGQLIEIGGSFRIPDVMEKSGAKMVEVGTTNKTHLRDYENAIKENTALICVVHQSNYRVKGFTSETDLGDLVQLAEKRELPILQDLGGGVLLDLRQHNLPYEPVAGESIRRGVDVVTFSGDKVLGGPQSGIIIGKRKYLDGIKKNPLMRALRCDKLIYATLESTLRLYFQEKDLLERNYVLKMLVEPVVKLGARARTIINKISNKAKNCCEIKIADTVVQIGSGALPLEELQSKAISLNSEKLPTEDLAKKFRMYEPPIIGYIRDDRLFFDLRSVFEKQDEILVEAIDCILGA
ncbi:L-seryl-tRNA(Sec) selenium transferase [candidate division KSB1 bacterium]|nr:L-seryl-tRNA(Sec) selenium transferase [candidate division KSB1 bacterium]NIR72133.1 L-seryl-tRNA(Sec) selenium transferase [candidate division KSB1 bacterium]NIS26598.1 L-seryl-tRNA(Sec) selenium transferase [candidate division KSB1 bacterium]NIT73366.1 L-seryl-tRNA(Sec) selenium transferase [candidate division KSB1 bacterium]NIU27214.1 L-seryl-tRNA(Sec) selenium transferase [candidate division KSB1 bacterium]